MLAGLPNASLLTCRALLTASPWGMLGVLLKALFPASGKWEQQYFVFRVVRR